MKIGCIICSLLLLTFSWAQKKEETTGKTPLVNEYLLSANYGLEKRGFFGAGLGLCHVMRSEKVVGFRSGIGLDFFHFWDGNTLTPVSLEPRNNQHYYVTNLSIPFDLQINFGAKVRFLFELGGQFGVNAYTVYRADVYNNQVDEFIDTRSELSLKTFVGANSGIGVCVPLNNRLGLLLKPSLGLNLYPESPAFLDKRLIHYFGRFSVSLRIL